MKTLVLLIKGATTFNELHTFHCMNSAFDILQHIFNAGRGNNTVIIKNVHTQACINYARSS